MEHKRFQWKYGTGINISTFIKNDENTSILFGVNKFNYSLLCRNYFNFNISQHIDLQLITNIYLTKLWEENFNQIQFNTGFSYKF